MKNTTDKTLSAALPPVTLTLDPLTGLLSRNSFLEQVRIRLDQDAPKDWCIATIDLEHFKLFNDWYGQEAGDRLLQNIADYLKRIQDCYVIITPLAISEMMTFFCFFPMIPD